MTQNYKRWEAREPVQTFSLMKIPKKKSGERKSSHENLVLGIIWLNFKFHMYVCEEKDFCLRRYWISVFPEGGTGNSGVGI